MPVLNPYSIISMIKQGNPRQVAQQIIQTQYAHDPMMQQIYQMGLNNDVKGLEQFARQYFGQQGRDFDAELNRLLNEVRKF